MRRPRALRRAATPATGTSWPGASSTGAWSCGSCCLALVLIAVGMLMGLAFSSAVAPPTLAASAPWPFRNAIRVWDAYRTLAIDEVWFLSVLRETTGINLQPAGFARPEVVSAGILGLAGVAGAAFQASGAHLPVAVIRNAIRRASQATSSPPASPRPSTGKAPTVSPGTLRTAIENVLTSKIPDWPDFMTDDAT